MDKIFEKIFKIQLPFRNKTRDLMGKFSDAEKVSQIWEENSQKALRSPPLGVEDSSNVFCTFDGKKVLEEICWKNLVPKEEMEAIKLGQMSALKSFEDYIIGDLTKHTCQILKIRNIFINDSFHIELYFKNANEKGNHFFEEIKRIVVNIQSMGIEAVLSSTKSSQRIWKLDVKINRPQNQINKSTSIRPRKYHDVEV